MRLAPWHVKGIGPQARESAREAARRSGMSLGQWLNSVILDQAAQDAIDDDPYDDFGTDDPRGDDLASITERLDGLGRQIERLAGNPAGAAERDGGVSRRIADAIQNLSGRLDRLIDEGRSASSALEQRVNSVDEALAKLGRERVRAAASYAGGDPVSVSVEQATAEITARQHALDDDLAAPVPDIVRRYAPPQCRADAAVDSLRKDLTEIGRVIAEAMPREAVEALEGEVRALGSRLDTAQRSAAQAPSVAHLERGLHEVRDALRGLAPAESLSGFDAAIRALSNKIDKVAGARQDPAGLQQIEAAIGSLRGLVAQVASADALANLSHEVRSLSDRLERGAPASGGADALASLSHEVRSLGERIDRGAPASGNADMLASLDRRIASIADAIETVRAQPARESSPQLDTLVNSLNEKLDRLQAAQSAPRGDQLVFRDLEDSIAKLTEKLDASQGRLGHLEAIERDMSALSSHLQAMQAPPVVALDGGENAPSAPLSRGEQIAIAGLEDRIAKLSEKLDASEGRLGQLASIERGMAELLTHLEAMRAAQGGGRREPLPPEPAAAAETETETETLSSDVAALRQAQSAGERRTRDSLEDVQGTIETVVDRLATIETTIRTDPRGGPLPPGPEPSPEPPLPSPSLSGPAGDAPRAAPPPAPPPASPARSARPPSPSRAPIDPSLPADHPLEPGSGPPRLRTAVSVAAGQGANPAASPPAGSAASFVASAAATVAERVAASEAPLRATNGGAAEAEPKANYLQAARRAAQMAQASQRRDAPGVALDIKPASTRSQRLKTVFVGLSVVVLILAALRFAMTYFFDFAAITPPQGPAFAERQAPGPAGQGMSADVPVFGQGLADAPVVARPGTAPGGGARTVSVVPPVMQPATPTLLPPISSSAPAAPSIAPPGASLSPLFAPYVPSAAPRAEAAPPSAAAGDVTGTITPQPAPSSSAAPSAVPAAPAPVAAPAIDRLPSGIGGAALIAAANAGEPAAAYEVATRFAEGHGVPQSFPQAAIWYERAAKGGLAPALFRLGALYEKGEGVAKDLNEARRLYLAAADKGNVNAMHNIGVLYAEGIDGKPDFKSASQWFRKSAMYGVADSQYNLAVLYARGIGLDRDFAEAFRWFSLAAKSGDADAGKKRDEIASHLDPKTLALARQAVDGFAPQQAPEEAATVKPPPGGWDQAQPGKRKPASSARARSKDRAI